MSGRVRPYRLSLRAQSDLEDIWLYTFENWSLEQADLQVALGTPRASCVFRDLA